MPSENLLSSVQQHLGPDTIQQISEAIGADPSATNSAISMALPALIGGLSHNASQPQGAAALDQALDAHDGSILGNLGGILGGGGGGGIGGAILGHIFGSKRPDVETGVSRASGLNAGQVAQLLMMLAPIVMGALGRMKRQGGVDASNLPHVLQQSSGGFDLNNILNAGESVLGNLFGNR